MPALGKVLFVIPTRFLFQHHRDERRVIRTAVKSLHLFLRIDCVQQRRKPVRCWGQRQEGAGISGKNGIRSCSYALQGRKFLRNFPEFVLLITPAVLTTMLPSGNALFFLHASAATLLANTTLLRPACGPPVSLTIETFVHVVKPLSSGRKPGRFAASTPASAISPAMVRKCFSICRLYARRWLEVHTLRLEVHTLRHRVLRDACYLSIAVQRPRAAGRTHHREVTLAAQ